MTTKQKQLNKEIIEYRRLKDFANSQLLIDIYDKYIEATKVEMGNKSTTFERSLVCAIQN